MPIEIRTATDDEREALHVVGQQAFAAQPVAFDLEADRTGIPLERRLVAADGATVAGKLGIWELGQWFGGRRVATGGVSGVAVDPAYRGRGVASRLVRAAVDAMRERGEALATLYPMNHALYRGHGWEIAGSYPQQELATQALTALPRSGRPVTLRHAADAELPRLLELYHDVARHEPGNLWLGSRFAARRLPAARARRQTYVAEVDGTVTGFLTLSHTDAAAPREFYAVEIGNLVAADGDTELALWRLVGSHHPVALTARLVAPTALLLPTLLGERAAQPYGPGWCWMTRLVDAAAAVAARGYPSEVDAEIHLDIDDPLAAWNHGRHVLTVREGAGRLEPGGNGAVHVGVGHLAAMYTGWADPHRLAGLGLLRGAGDRELAALSRAFAGRSPWMREFF